MIKTPYMFSLRPLIVVTALAIFVVLGMSVSSPSRSGRRTPRNLQVLPADISPAKLDSIMQSYARALHVDCGFCHNGPGTPDDFAADRNPMKQQARKMIRMTLQLNRDYFRFDTTWNPAYYGVVSCITCHRGDPMPVDIR